MSKNNRVYQAALMSALDECNAHLGECCVERVSYINVKIKDTEHLVYLKTARVNTEEGDVINVDSRSLYKLEKEAGKQKVIPAVATIYERDGMRYFTYLDITKLDIITKEDTYGLTKEGNMRQRVQWPSERDELKQATIETIGEQMYFGILSYLRGEEYND